VFAALLLLAVSGMIDGTAKAQPGWIRQLLDLTGTFKTVFLAIFVEGLPFLLLGALSSGILAVFVTSADLVRWLPKHPLGGAFVGALLGLVFPVGLPGSILLARRLLRMGVPAPAGVALLLAGPVLNPVALAVMFLAFGPGPLFWARLALGAGAAVLTGLVFSGASMAGILRPEAQIQTMVEAGKRGWAQAAVIAADELFDYGRFLVLGSILAALLQMVIHQTGLLTLAQGPFATVLVMAGLGGLLSPGAASAPLTALGLPGIGPAGMPLSSDALLAFLVCAPLVDLKVLLIDLRAFRSRAAAYLLLVPLLLALISLVFLGIFWPGWGG
jgi:uncharacterized protein